MWRLVRAELRYHAIILLGVYGGIALFAILAPLWKGPWAFQVTANGGTGAVLVGALLLVAARLKEKRDRTAALLPVPCGHAATARLVPVVLMVLGAVCLVWVIYWIGGPGRAGNADSGEWLFKVGMVLSILLLGFQMPTDLGYAVVTRFRYQLEITQVLALAIVSLHIFYLWPNRDGIKLLLSSLPGVCGLGTYIVLLLVLERQLFLRRRSYVD